MPYQITKRTVTEEFLHSASKEFCIRETTTLYADGKPFDTKVTWKERRFKAVEYTAEMTKSDGDHMEQVYFRHIKS